jgi:hypothetical protein
MTDSTDIEACLRPRVGLPLVLANCPLMLANYKSIDINSRAAVFERRPRLLPHLWQLCCS